MLVHIIRVSLTISALNLSTSQNINKNICQMQIKDSKFVHVEWYNTEAGIIISKIKY